MGVSLSLNEYCNNQPHKVPYLFELSPLVPRPNFEGVLLSKYYRANTLLVLQTVITILHMKRTLNIKHLGLPNNLL